ncbi:MAG TPA: hypothetical protein VLW88_11935 [Hyphomicrobium sp.]|jgi:hypothetical protein|nr:hypothetical protein [Hyphomicrobium sp.]
MRGENFGRVAAPLAAISAALFVFGVGLSVAQAEDTKPADTTPPAATAPPAATTPAKPAATTTPATPKTTDTKTAATPSPCKGLDETACKANTACTWYKEAKLKDGKTRKAHCQKKPTPKPKKTDTKTQ